jgi:hypothetical protein
MLQSQNPYSPERIDALTKSLSTMDARARQQYAAQHKDDPAVVAVALNVSNILAAAERNKAMQAGGQQQPKVVDQEIAGMAPPQQRMAPPPQHMARLPEQQGIAQLQAPNLEGMADGGIAGYADGGNNMATGGGPASQLAFNNEPVMRMAGGGEVKKYAGVTGEQLVRTTDGGQSWWLDIPAPSRGNLSPASSLANRKFTSRDEAIAAYNAIAGGGEAPAPSPVEPSTKDLVLPYGQTKATNVLGNTAAVTANTPAPGATPPPPGAAPERPQPALATGLPSIAQAKKAGEELYGSKELEDKINQQRLQERQDIANEKEARSEKLAAFNKEQGPAMAGYSKILDAQEKEDTTDKEKSGLMALFKGFLAMASGESPHAAVNIAKGSMVGLEDYASSLKDLKKSAKERGKERAYIEQAQRAEGRDDFKSQMAYEDKANDASRAADHHAMDAITKVTGQKGEGATRIYTEMLQQASANARTNAQIAAGKGPGPTEHLYKTLGGGDVAKGLGVYANVMGPEGKGMEAELQAYIKNPMQLKATNPDLAAQFDAIIKQRMGSMVKPQAGVGSRD